MIPLPGLQYIKLAGLALLVLGTAYVTHGFDKGRYEALKASYANAAAVALQQAIDEQKRLDALSTQAAELEAAAQAKLTAHYRRQVQEVSRHAKAYGHCLTYGAVRVLLGAASGRGADSLSLPAGKSDFSCAPAQWLDVLRGIVQDYGDSRANAQQLDALTKFLRETTRK